MAQYKALPPKSVRVLREARTPYYVGGKARKGVSERIYALPEDIQRKLDAEGMIRLAI